MDLVKQLRDETDISIMQCKKALEEADGDIEQARIALQQKGREIAAKKAERELGAGAVQAYVHASNDIGALVQLSCETDFVAKNEEFIALARELAMHITAAQPDYIQREDVPAATLEQIRAQYADEFADKPAEVQEKALTGKVDAYLAERVLYEQPHIKDQETTIGALIEGATQKFGERVAVSHFALLSAR